MIEGGEFRCYDHDFVTSDSEEWYKHCESKDENNKPIHTEEGSTECVFCHAPNIQFKGLPWTRPGTTKGAVCDTCQETHLRSISR